ncbi:hypothetical protein Fmac_011155 [Flemingia macrophylla]|uniref:18S rRNA (guanine(1575)-N(7))-methyltransferase Bud23 C-terminal domain-containing protein n=1 Tax=Flemingia macrophylla TaxID=520843 RepID=A0ABD1MLR0_9FABA
MQWLCNADKSSQPSIEIEDVSLTGDQLSYDSSKRRKEFLVLTCGQSSLNACTSTRGETEDGEIWSDEDSEDEENQTVCIPDRHRPRKNQKKNNKSGRGKEWLLRKKEQMRSRGNVLYLQTPSTMVGKGRIALDFVWQFASVVWCA